MTDEESKIRFLKHYDLQNGNGNKLPVVEKKQDIVIYVGVLFFIILII